MTQSTTTVLEQTAKGPIQIVWNGVFASVQFNTDCLDALHLCHGMCCRSRSGYSVELEPDEVDLYWHRQHPTSKVPILQTKEDGSCVYLTEEGRCGTYKTRPKMCRQWHCSPHGQMGDAEIERRDAGWMLLPVRKEEADFVSLRRE
jgi:Fe-S-cluster containining protein